MAQRIATVVPCCNQPLTQYSGYHSFILITSTQRYSNNQLLFVCLGSGETSQASATQVVFLLSEMVEEEVGLAGGLMGALEAGGIG